MRRSKWAKVVGGLTLALLLVSASLPASAQEPAVRRYVKWDRLSAEIIPKIQKKNHDFGAAVKHFRKAACTMELTFTFNVSPNPMGGTFAFSWNDLNDNGILTEDEIELDIVHLSRRELGYLIRDLREALKRELATTTFNIFSLCNTKSVRKGDGYLIELRPSSEVRINKYMAFDKLYVTVNRDFLTTHVQTTTLDGVEMSADLKHARLGDYTVLSGIRERSEKPSGEVKIEDRTDQYALVQGIPMPVRMVSDTQVTVVTGTVTIRSDTKFVNWKVEKRTTPIAEVLTVAYEEMFRNARNQERPLIEVEGEAPPDRPDRPLVPDRPDEGGGGGIFEDDPPDGGTGGGGIFEEDPPDGAATGPTEAEKQLGREVVAKINAAYFGWGRYPVRTYAAKCCIGSTPDQPRAEYEATSDRGLTQSRIIDFRTLDQRTVLKFLHYAWSLPMAGPLFRGADPPELWVATRTADGYLLKGLDGRGSVLDEVKVAADFTVRERTQLIRSAVTAEYVRLRIVLHTVIAEGVKFLQKAVLTQGTDRRTFTFKYRHVEGLPFLKRVEIEAAKDGQPVHAKLHVTSVEFR